MSLVLALLGCGDDPVPEPSEGWSGREQVLLDSLRLVTPPPPDDTNPYSGYAPAEVLGAKLFFDPKLSGDNGVSCATCHDPALHFSDGKKRSVGVGETRRHAPTIPGSQWGEWFTWDGRADSQWSQAAGPLEDPAEMGTDRVSVVRYVVETYPDAYVQVAGALPDLSTWPEPAAPVPGPLQERWDALSPADQKRVNTEFARVLQIIGAYEHTLVPMESPFDRYVDAVRAGDPSGGGHLSEQAVDGLRLFIGRGNCVSCHLGPMFTDRAFHNLGLPEEQRGYDQGRTVGAMQVRANLFNCESEFSAADDCPELTYLNPTFDDFIAAFKTPSLREVARTGPYMHNGMFATLDEVLAFYSALPGEPRAGHRELTLVPLELTADEVTALKAFLGSLSGGELPDSVVHPAP